MKTSSHRLTLFTLYIFYYFRLLLLFSLLTYNLSFVVLIIMEFSLDDLDNIISKLCEEEEEASIGKPNKQKLHLPIKVKNEPCPLHEHSTTMLVNKNNMNDRQYCLIIFNNPRWSQRLRSKQTSSWSSTAAAAAAQVISNYICIMSDNFIYIV